MNERVIIVLKVNFKMLVMFLELGAKMTAVSLENVSNVAIREILSSDP
ncbi:MAG: hypothetical protein IH846_11075 [Acidobacteria bacterium]|nr:hypothetical protein [Acidobacteriota bacterium]